MEDPPPGREPGEVAHVEGEDRHLALEGLAQLHVNLRDAIGVLVPLGEELLQMIATGLARHRAPPSPLTRRARGVSYLFLPPRQDRPIIIAASGRCNPQPGPTPSPGRPATMAACQLSLD